MHLRTRLFLCAILAASGCGTQRLNGQTASARQWAMLCSRLRPAHQANSNPPRPPTNIERTRLENAARDTSASLVQIHTVLKPSCGVELVGDRVRKTSSRSGGSGVAIAAGGIILTNAHVLRGALTITVSLPDGSTHRVDRVVTDPRLDLAVLRVGSADLPPLAPSGESVTPGTPVIAVSSLVGDLVDRARPGVVTRLTVSLQNQLDPTRRRDFADLIESTTHLAPGFSGGPLLDSKGRFVGLNVAATGTPGTEQTRGYAIPFNERTRLALASLVTEVTLKR